MNTRSNWIRDRREEIGIRTQDDLAAMLQLEGFTVTRAAVSHWENDRNPPPLQNAEFRRILGRVLKLSESDLLRLSGYEFNIEHSNEAERAAALVDQMPDEKRHIALKLLEALL